MRDGGYGGVIAVSVGLADAGRPAIEIHALSLIDCPKARSGVWSRSPHAAETGS
jgi:hypothetical protein